MRDYFKPPEASTARRCLIAERGEPGHYEWVWVSEDETGGAGQGELAELVDQLATRPPSELVVVLSADLVALRTVELTEAERKHGRQLIPYALEEGLTENADELHFAYTPWSEGRIGVAIARREAIEEVLARFGERGMSIGALVPEALLLPWSEDTQAWLARDGEVVARTGFCCGFIAPLEAVAIVAGLPGPDKGNQCGNIEWVSRRGSPESAPGVSPVLSGRSVSHIQVAHALEWQARFLADCPLNLLQGEYSPAPPWHRLWLQWRPVAAAVLVALLANFAVLAYHFQSEKQRAAELQAAKYALAGGVLTGKIRSPERQLRAALAQAQSSGPMDFAGLIARVGPRLAGKAGYSLRSINYDGGSGALRIEVRAGSHQQIEQLRNALEAQRLQARLLSSNARSGGILARLEVREMGG